MGSIYLTEITALGPEVPDFLEAGVLILFQQGAPPELAEISVLHAPIALREKPPRAGDVLAIGPLSFRITAVGKKAWENVMAMGHAVFKFDGATEGELPGEIRLEPGQFEELGEVIRPGAQVEIREEMREEAHDVA